MAQFIGNWCRELKTKPPSPEAVRQFLVDENGRDTFEYRIVDGSCQLLLGCSFDEWINSPKQAQDTLQELSSPPQSNSETYHLNEAISAPLGKISNVPNLPLNFLPRPDELNAIKAAVLVSTNQSVAVTGTAHRVGVQGMGGIGKSVLAAEIARDEEVRRAFPDGVLWVTLGQTPMRKLTKWQAHLAEVLGAGQRTFTDIQLGKAFLSELLADKACLLILDDVWQAKHAAAFDALGQRCKMLLTTRDRGLITALGAVVCQLGVLSNEQALALLALWAGQHEETLPTEAHDVVRECGNLPLALAMIGAMVRGKPDRWANVLHKLRNADLEKIRHQFPDYPYSDLLKAIQISVEDLKPDEQRRYLDFAVFPEDTPIPEATLQTFWEPEGLNKHDTQDVVYLLVERSLAQRDDKGRLGLHDLQYDYVRKQAGDLSVLHNQLLSAYAKQCPNGWHTGTNDGYFFEHLAYHLKESERKEELYSLLTESPDWMEAKFIACTGDAAYVADLELAISDFTDPLAPNQLLTLTQLHTARQAVNHRVSCYNDNDLKTLVWLDREAEALSYARLRSDAKKRFDGLLTIYKTLQAKGKSQPELLNEAWEITKIVDDTAIEASRIEAFCDLIPALIEAGLNDEANTVFQEARRVVARKDVSELYTLETHSKLAIALVRAGREQEAEPFLIHAEELAKNINYDFFTARALNTLVVGLIQAKRFTEAKKIVLTSEHIFDRTRGLINLAQALAQAEHFKEADQVLKTIKAEAIKDRSSNQISLIYVLTDIATVLAQTGQAGDKLKAGEAFAEAIELSWNIDMGMDISWWQVEWLSYVAAAMAKTGHKVKADEVFAEIKELAKEIKEDIYCSEALEAWAQALKKADRFNDVNEIITKAWEIAQEIKSSQEKAKILIRLSSVSTQAEHFKEAEKVAQTIKSFWDRTEALNNLAEALAEAGYEEKATAIFEEVVQLVRAIRNTRLLNEAESSVLGDVLVKAGYFAQALTTLSLQELDQFFCILREWITDFRKVEPGISLAILREVLRIGSWVCPNWREIYEVFPAQTTS
jgi:tetratricopeptide (TPR) repeat protein